MSLFMFRPSEQEVRHAMKVNGTDRLQAYRQVQQQKYLQYKYSRQHADPYPLGKSMHFQ